jgi:hypothetical protein
MNWGYILTGCCLLILAGALNADFVSTTISTDGSFLMASSGTDHNGTYTAHVKGVGDSKASRVISGDDALETDLTAVSSGPLLLSDYASSMSVAQKMDNLKCVFTEIVDRGPVSHAEMTTAGILDHGGNYTISRLTSSSGLTGLTSITGAGHCPKSK